MRKMSALVGVLLTLALQPGARASTTCSFSSGGTTWTLLGDCTTNSTILVTVPHLSGGGYTITALDPAGNHFRGAVVQAGTDTLHVENLNLTSSGLADVCDAGADRLRGILWEGASGSANLVNVTNVNQGPSPTQPSGCQEGNSLEVRNFGHSPTTIHVVFDTVKATGYQKTGIVCNGDSDCTITDSIVTGAGPQNYIAQNGIQIGFGATGSVKRNQVSGNAYTGGSTVSGGIIVVAGPFYGSAFSVGDQIMNNTLTKNDIGVWLSQINADESAPSTKTNIKVVGNLITNSSVTNGFPYQAGVADQGNNDKIINNTISGAGYQGVGIAIDADASFTNRPKVHANK